MLGKTHIALAIANILYFLPYMNNEVIFSVTVLISSLLPDIDSAFSTLGEKKIFRPVQWVFGHRGFIHSFTFCIAVSLLLAFFYPVFAFPFFIGYGFHLLLDSFSVQGIRPFWPIKKESKGFIRTGGNVERAVFIVLVLVDLALLVKLFI